MPPLRGTDFTDHMAEAAKKLGWQPFRAARRDQLADLQGPARLRVSRLLRHGRMPHQREEFDGGHHDPGSAEDQEPHDLRSAQVTRIVRGREWPRHGRHLYRRRQGVLSAGEGGSAGVLHLRELPVAAALEIEGLSRTGLSNNHGQVGRHYFGHWRRQAGGGAVSRSTSTSGTGCRRRARRRRLGRRQLRSRRARLHRRHQSARAHGDASDRAAAHARLSGARPRWGSKWKEFVQQNAARFASTYLQTTTFPYEARFWISIPK